MTHTTRATELAGAGKTDEAIEELLAALELDPQYLPAHANLIQFYSNPNRFDKAEHHFRAAVASGSPAPTARLHYARSLIKQQRLLEAVPVLEELLDSWRSTQGRSRTTTESVRGSRFSETRTNRYGVAPAPTAAI